MSRVLNYRSAAVSDGKPDPNWVIGPGELRAVLPPARRWLRAVIAAGIMVPLGLVLIYLVAVAALAVVAAVTTAARSAVTVRLTADQLIPIVGFTLLTAIVWRCMIVLLEATRPGGCPVVVVDNGHFGIYDPTQGARLRLTTADVADVRVVPLAWWVSGGGRIRVRVWTVAGRRIDYHLRTADVRVAGPLEAELRRAVQLTTV